MIGRGSFTKCYLVDENNVLLKTTCPTKEAYYMFSQGNPLAPVINDVSWKGKEWHVRMPYYRRVIRPGCIEVPRLRVGTINVEVTVV